MQLFCFSHAGGSAAGYVRWQQRLPAWIRVQPVELPGRGRRAREPLQTRFSSLLAHVAVEVRPEPGQLFAFFGHSLGSLLAFELSWQRWQAGAALPAALLVAGAPAPFTRDPERFARALSDDELRAELAQLGGTPQAVLDSAELMSLVLPIVRADFQVVADYRCARDEGATLAAGLPVQRRIPCPIHVFGGIEDATTPENLAAWKQHTVSACGVNMFPGGHFFVQHEEAQLLSVLEQRLSQCLRSSNELQQPAAL
jgi:surfactin synthase thioesterase subunit